MIKDIKHGIVTAFRTIQTPFPLGRGWGWVVVALLLTSCQSNEDGTVDLSRYTPEPEVTLVYNHPCALYSKADFARVKAAIAAGTLTADQQAEWTALQQSPYVMGDYGVTSHATQQIVRGDAKGTIEGSENYIIACRDAAAAYQFGLLWQLTGNATYAQKGVFILKDWVSKCKEVTANDNNQYLAAGAQGYTFALAAEELRDYSGWSESEFTEFKNWILNVFADKNYKFLQLHGSSNCGSPKHYMSNWDMVNLCSYLQIGILTENDEIIQYCTNYFTKSGDGLGALPNIQQYTYDFTLPDGTKEKVTQAQESGRDQGHATMAIVVAAHLAQSAWALYEDNPTYTDLDYFTSNDNALLRLAEYNAMANLKTGTHADINGSQQGGEWLYAVAQIPFTPAGPWCSDKNHEAGNQQTAFGEKERGNLRPGYEIYYKHYKDQAGSYFVKKYAAVQRPECGSGDSRYGSNSGAFDQIGWGTLMLYQ
ncbi:MAG: alginate lyase family protein [Prevotella sp.]|nr:alginate lyase family protein [Prevotella sp.]